MLPKPVKVQLKGDGLSNLKGHVKDRLTAIKNGLNEFHTVKLPEWRRIYEARPLEQSRSIPFENACDLVVPIVAIHSDTLKARLMAAIFRTRPIWVVNSRGEWQGEAEPIQKDTQEFMETEAMETESLDLYRVYNEAIDDVIQYGTMFVKSPWEVIQNHLVIPAGDGDGKFDYVENTDYDGPRPEKIPLEDFFMSPTEKTTERANFKAHRRRLYRYELEDRAFRGIYDKDAVESILGHPDRIGPSYTQTQDESSSGIKSPSGEVAAQWDIYECWFWYRDTSNKLVKIIASFHLASDTLLRAHYNFLPDDPFVGARLLSRDGSYYGRGFCEVLGMFEEEISQIHCQRRDAQTVANAKVWRIDPFSKLHQGFKIYPSAIIPAAKDEIEAISHGEPTSVNIDEERLSLELAERRSGISPPMQSYGSGSFNKRGVYSAMGTLSLLQEGNNRTDLSVSDIRYFHTKLGRILARQYAALGLNPERFEGYGKASENIQKGLKAILSKKMYLPIIAPTASVNREVEKQSDVMLVGIMTRHYQAVAGFLGQAMNPQMPPQVKTYLEQAAVAMNKLMKSVLKHFDYDDPDAFAPEVLSGQQQQQKQIPPGPEQQSAIQKPPGDAVVAVPGGSDGFSGLGGGGERVQ